MEMPELNRKHAIFGVLVILILVIAFNEGAILLESDLDYTSRANSSVTFGVYKYEDGEFLPIPVERIYNSPYSVGGVPATEIAPKVDWVSTGEGIDWPTFEMSGSLDVKYLQEVEQEGPGGVPYWTYTWKPYQIIPIASETPFAASDSWFKVFVLGTDLCLPAHYIQYRETGDHAGESGWQYSFSGSIYGTVYDEMGTEPRLSDSTHFGTLVVWITYDAWYNIEVTIT